MTTLQKREIQLSTDPNVNCGATRFKLTVTSTATATYWRDVTYGGDEFT